MIRIRHILYAAAALAAVPAQAQTAAPPGAAFRPDGTREGIAMERIAEGVYQFNASFDGYVERTNSVAIVGREGVLVFDTNTRPSTARAVLAMLRTVTSQPVRWVVNSHWHPDHWSGNQVYAEAFPGVEIITTEATAQYMRDVAPSWPTSFAGGLRRLRESQAAARAAGPLSEDALKEQATALAERENFVTEMTGVRRTYPTRTYRGRLTLDLGGRTVELTDIFGDASHSTMAFLPRERILLAGDALVHPVTWTPNGNDIEPWVESLRAMGALDPQLIVPGHGPLLRDKAYLTLVTEFMAALIAQAHAALAAGAVTPDDVIAKVDLSAFRERFTHGDADLQQAFDHYAPEFVRRVYRELRDGMESRR